MPDRSTTPETAADLPAGRDKPLSKSLLGDEDSGGLAGQGGMVPEDLDLEDDEA